MDDYIVKMKRLQGLMSDAAALACELGSAAGGEWLALGGMVSACCAAVMGADPAVIVKMHKAMCPVCLEVMAAHDLESGSVN